MKKTFNVVVTDDQQVDIALTSFIITGIFILVLLALQKQEGLFFLDPISNFWKGLFNK